MKNST